MDVKLRLEGEEEASIQAAFERGGESSKVVHIYFFFLSASSASLERRHFAASSSAPRLRWRERICERTLKTFVFSGLIEPIRLLRLLAARSGFLQGGRENSVYLVQHLSSEQSQMWD